MAFLPATVVCLTESDQGMYPAGYQTRMYVIDSGARALTIQSTPGPPGPRAGPGPAALVAGVVVLVTALWLALLVEGSAAGMDVPLADSAAALVHLGLLGIEFGALALLVGSLTGHLGATRAVPALVAVVAYLVNAFAPLASWLGPVRAASPFYQYIGHDPLSRGLWPAALGVTLLSTAALLALAAWSFRRRDVLT